MKREEAKRFKGVWVGGSYQENLEISLKKKKASVGFGQGKESQLLLGIKLNANKYFKSKKI